MPPSIAKPKCCGVNPASGAAMAFWRLMVLTPQHFGFAIEGGIATVTLNRPEKKNPLTFESYAPRP
jgi:hypothetical protein